MDADFPQNNICFSHKMKNVNRQSHQWNIGIKILICLYPKYSNHIQYKTLFKRDRSTQNLLRDSV